MPTFAERHPIGFVKVVALRLPGGRRLRLHIWRGGIKESIHNHRWSFTSIPLLGAFDEHLYDEVPGDAYQRLTVLDEAGRDGSRVYKLVGSSDLELTDKVTHRPLRPYRRKPDEIHCLKPRNARLSVTLVLTGRLKRTSSAMWRTADSIDVPISDASQLMPEPVVSPLVRISNQR